MADNLRQVGRHMALYARMDLRWFLQDMGVCLIVICSDFAMTIAGVTGVFLLAMRFQGVGAMSEWEVLFMLGFYTLAGGALFMLFGGSNIHQISRRIGRGQVDHMLMQPVPIWVQILGDGFMPTTGSSGLIMGFFITGYAAVKLQLAVTPLWLLKALLLVIANVGIEMGLSFLLASSAFYKPVTCEEISSVGHDLLVTIGKYPLSGLSPALITALCTVLPAGLMAWFPCLILLGKAPAGPALLLPLGVAAMLITLSTVTFKKGLRHYAQYSCNRYRDMGHRN